MAFTFGSVNPNLDAMKTSTFGNNTNSTFGNNTNSTFGNKTNNTSEIGNSACAASTPFSFNSPKTFGNENSNVVFGNETNNTSKIDENLSSANSNKSNDQKRSNHQDIEKQIDKSIMDLIMVDMLPCSVVDGTAFQRLKFAVPTTVNSYKPKSGHYFSATLWPETCNNIKENVLTMLAKTPSISLTIDNCSLVYNNSNLLLVTFTAHFLLDSIKKKLVLAAKVLENDQKDSYIVENFPEIIKNFKLEKKLHVVVSDKEHNIETTKITAFECVAHTIQLIVQDIIFKKKHVEDIITKCRKVTKQASETLCLLQDVETNWISSYLMMKKFIEQKSEISLYSNKMDIENLTTEEWNLLKVLLEALESIYEATTYLTADTATISLIIPLIELLNSKLKEDNTANELQNELKVALNERFKFIETSPLLIMSTLLDPRFKNKYLSITQMSIADKEISNFLHMDTVNTLKTCSEAVQQKSNNTLWEKHDLTIETDSLLRNELSLYINEPILPRNSNICMYWNKSRYEKLKKIAEKYLSVPPTVVANEQMLEAAGRLYAERRAILKDVNVEKLLFCHFNIQLLDFNY